MISWLAESLLELIYPERCVLCGTGRGTAAWSRSGPRDPGLRFWDTTHLCRACEAGLESESKSVVGLLDPGTGSGLPVVAAARTNGDLVKLVGAFKYHGLRGLAWPLGRMLAQTLGHFLAANDGVEVLVPVPLHRARRRTRGFNQAEILARLASEPFGIQVNPGALVRRRRTAQQARITSPAERRSNLATAFRPRPSPAGRGALLVDDLVTSGHTALAAAEALRSAGWRVCGVLGLGMAPGLKNSPGRVDTLQGGF